MKAITIDNQSLKTVQTLLRYTYAIVPIVAGIDKFTNLLTDWDKYLNPAVADLLPFSPHIFMMLVGVIEIVAGVIVFFRPRIGGYIVMAWLVAIALSLIAGGQFLDIAVRDLVMAVEAFTLAKLTEVTNQEERAAADVHGRAGEQALAG